MTDNQDPPAQRTFVPGNARLNALLTRPDPAAEVAKVEAEIETKRAAQRRIGQ